MLASHSLQDVHIAYTNRGSVPMLSAYITALHNAADAGGGINFAVIAQDENGATARLYNPTDYNPVYISVKWHAVWLP